MRHLIPALLVLVALCPTFAADAPLNAPLAVGWRGDGTGHFPAADPPVEWSRRSTSLLWGMRNAGDVPADAAADPATVGTAVPPTLGWLERWQVLGPIAVPDGTKALTEGAIADEGNLTPAAVPDQAGAAKWQALSPGGDLYLDRALGKGANRVAYLHTAVHTKAGGKVTLWVGAHTHGVRVWLNGQAVFTRDRSADNNARARSIITLKPGWNRLLYKLTQGDRGWSLSTWLSAAPPVGYAMENVGWVARLPGPSMGSPIAVGDSLFCVSEPNELVCLDKATGKLRWIRRTSAYDAATPEQQRSVAEASAPALARLAEIDAATIAHANGPDGATRPLDAKLRAEKERINREMFERMAKVDPEAFRIPQKQDHGYTTPTPFSDGQRVYVSFTTGVAAAYDLAGNRVWMNFDNRGNYEHGNHYSPVVAGDRVIFCMRNWVRAVDARTGKQLWQHKNRHTSYNSPVLARIEGQDVIVTGSGTLLRASDGKVIGTPDAFGGGGCPSPVVHDGVIYSMGSGGAMLAIELPRTIDAAESRELWQTDLVDRALEAEFGIATTFAGGFVASPLYHDGLLYLVSEGGILIVLDAKTGARVYGRLLDLHPRVQYISAPGVAASPFLAGGRIYIFDNSGESLVIAPGREYRQLARNTLENILGPGEWNESQEQLMSTPLPDGPAMYVRSPEFMYCIRR